MPELCYMTGLTESMKNNRQLMISLREYTLVTPEVRQKSLIDFVDRIKGMKIYFTLYFTYLVYYFNLLS